MGVLRKKFIVFERSEFMNFSSILIFQVGRKNWPSLFGYFCDNDKSNKSFSSSMRFASVVQKTD